MINELKTVCRPLAAGLAAAIAAGTLAGISSLALMGLSAWLIASAALQVPLYILSLSIVGVRFCGIMRAVLRYMERYLSHKTGFAVFMKFRVLVLHGIIDALPFKRQTSDGDAFTVIVEAVDKIRDSFLRFFLPPITATLICAAVMAWSGFYSLEIVLILFSAWLIFIVIVPIAAWRFYRKKSDFRLSLAENVMEFYEGGRELFVYDCIDKKMTNVKQAIGQYQQRQKENFAIKSKVELVCEILLGAFIAAILGTLIYSVEERQLNAVTAITLLLTMQSVMEILAAVPPLTEHLDEAERSWRTLKAFTGRRDIKTGDDNAFSIETENEDKAVLSVENITFGYKTPLCRNMSFKLYEGRKTLLVGGSGCGKSTLFYVLTGLLEVFSGNMYLQGKNYKQWNKEKWRNHFAASFQEHHVFNLSVRDNFRIFYPDITDEEIWLALDKVQFADFVRRHGLNYVLAGDGANLSGGQKQRLQLAISLARKKNIILLDEPTAGLDIISAHRFLKQLVGANKKAAILVSSHDLSIAGYFDDVIIMGNKTITEQGNIKRLMQDENSYLHKMMKYNNLI